MTATQLVKRVKAERKSVCILFAMSLMNLLISRLNGKDCKMMRVVSFRSIIAEQKNEPEMTVRYYISSADLTAEKFATAVRNHWHVENKLHWRLDVVMNEDDCKIRRGNAAELFSGIRHIAINILTTDKVFKAGLRRKMRKAAMNRDYLASVFAGSRLS
ncbi:H repeat-associated protein yhhI [Escherichia coli KTE33]|nr:H repeat-associated protein yhhI [Escherichia coli KTE33]